HCDAWTSACSKTIRTARSRNSGAYRVPVDSGSILSRREPYDKLGAIQTLETIEIANKHRVSHHPVTLCSVTQPVRTFGTLQESLLRAGSERSVTGDRDSRAGDDRDRDERDSRDGERSSGICCGEVSDEWRGRPYAPACRLCPKADVYWRRAPAMTD